MTTLLRNPIFEKSFSSQPEMFFKKVFSNLCNYTPSSFLMKFQAESFSTLSKNTLSQLFCGEFYEFFENTKEAWDRKKLSTVIFFIK